MNYPVEQAVLAAIAALEAVQASSGALGLQSVHRIANRLESIVHDSEFVELRILASRIGANKTLEEAQSITSELNEIFKKRIAARAETLKSKSTTILLIEDDRLTARVLADHLAGPEREVLVATDAQQAQRLLRDYDVALIILDLVLPDADGRDLLVDLRSSPVTSATPILIVTAQHDPAIHTECFALGADGFLLKPVTSTLLRSSVFALLHHAAERKLSGYEDRLTGLPNRSAFMTALQRSAPLVQRHRESMSVAMIDLDHFKSINDQYGHAMGDEVLRRVAETIATTLRTSDMVARYGGEEFCAYFPNTHVDGAVSVLRRSLHTVRELEFFPENSVPFNVTFSAGVAELKGGQSAEEALAEADRYLYVAKNAGRNRVISGAEAGDLPRPSVLLVEDDPKVADLVRRLLDREGYEVHVYGDGGDALLGAAEHDFVLAIIDLNLPTVNGFGLVAELRRQRKFIKLPIVMLTGSDNEEDVVHGFELGISDYVTKPFFAAELVARINRLLA